MMDKENLIFKTGKVIDGKWVIVDFLGKGEMGEVYLAHQLNLDRRVAIKVISRQWINSFDEDPAPLILPWRGFGARFS